MTALQWGDKPAIFRFHQLIGNFGVGLATENHQQGVGRSGYITNPTDCSNKLLSNAKEKALSQHISRLTSTGFPAGPKAPHIMFKTHRQASPQHFFALSQTGKIDEPCAGSARILEEGHEMVMSDVAFWEEKLDKKNCNFWHLFHLLGHFVKVNQG